MKNCIFVLIFILLVSFCQAKIVFAQNETPSASGSSNLQKVEYALPYPGLLPDNPLYFIKAVRDRVIEFLISSHQKKAEFYLLSSDKRLNTGYYLIQKNKDDMGVLYISKSNNYMHKAISEGKKIEEGGGDLLAKMGSSIKKHEEVIKDMEAKVDQKNRTELEKEIKRLGDFALLIQKK